MSDVYCPLAIEWHFGVLLGCTAVLASTVGILKLYTPALSVAVLKS